MYLVCKPPLLYTLKSCLYSTICDKRSKQSYNLKKILLAKKHLLLLESYKWSFY